MSGSWGPMALVSAAIVLNAVTDCMDRRAAKLDRRALEIRIEALEKRGVGQQNDFNPRHGPQ